MNHMKKQILFGGMLLCAAAFTACTEDFTDWASPQSNAQGENEPAYAINFGAGSQANIVMDNATENVQIVSLTSSSDAVSSYKLKSITVNGISISGEIDGNGVYVNAAKLDSIIEATTFDRSATPHAIEVKTEVAARLSSGEAVPAEGVTSATLTPYSNVPEKDPKGYAMLGQWQGWNPSAPTWMTEVEPGVYQAVVTTTDDGDNWFKFYKGSGFDDADFSWDAVALGCAVNGDASSPNLLCWEGDPRFGGFQTPVINGASTWTVTLDMNKLYYKFERLESIYYLIGNPQGWTPNDITCLIYPLGNNQYSYTTKFTNQWDLKFFEVKYANAGDDVWNNVWGGENGSTAASGDLIFGSDAGAIGPNENGGWYTFTIDMNAMKYSWTAIDEPSAEYTNISLIGDFNGWAADVDLTALDKAPHNWYVRAAIPSDGGLKFRANHDWALSWGANFDISESYGGTSTSDNGPNINVPAGTYDFYFNDITGQFAIVAVE